MTLDAWFLRADERGNTGTRIDARRQDGRGSAEGNDVKIIVHGRPYFARLHEKLSELTRGDSLWFVNWRVDAEELLNGAGTELGKTFAGHARRGVDVRGLVWRSHPDREGYSERENARLAQEINDAGGKVLLDERVRRFGSHHQKIVLLRHAADPKRSVAFLGGIDLARGRSDDEQHLGDPQAIRLFKPYGPRPAWHDVQLEITGPAVGDIEETFRERWADPSPRESRSPLQRNARGARRPAPPLPPEREDPPATGSIAVQMLRTYPEKTPPFPFAPKGERSVARAYAKALARARSFIYVEDQYLWSTIVAGYFADALRNSPELVLIAVLPKYPDRDGAITGPLNRMGQKDAVEILMKAGGNRVAVYDIENEQGRPIYVHGKLCVIDDVWMTVGSDNFNRRSWTHDSEATCALVDARMDLREPRDPGGLGDGARVLPRHLRETLWREHLGAHLSEEQILDPKLAFAQWARSAEALDAWHAGGRIGPRPPGRVRRHHVQPVSRWAAVWAQPMYHLIVDPDGRPGDLRHTDAF